MFQMFFKWLQHTELATAVRESTFLFPSFESVHVLAITTVVGTIAIVDLRLLGLASRERPVSALMSDILPFTRAAFGLAVLTGSVLFVSHANDYVHKTPFVAKMVLLSLAFINIVLFHFVTARGIQKWDNGPAVPPTVKLAGGLSLAIWIGVVACGRWTGFV